jgi:hypothetical protein
MGAHHPLLDTYLPKITLIFKLLITKLYINCLKQNLLNCHHIYSHETGENRIKFR